MDGMVNRCQCIIKTDHQFLAPSLLSREFTSIKRKHNRPQHTKTKESSPATKIEAFFPWRQCPTAPKQATPINPYMFNQISIPVKNVKPDPKYVLPTQQTPNQTNRSSTNHSSIQSESKKTPKKTPSKISNLRLKSQQSQKGFCFYP